MAKPEKLLHFIWRFRLFNQLKLTSQTGQHVTILDTGVLNEDAGPDFLSAKIKIDDQVWVGNVEIHWDAKDWFKHRHDLDAQYQNVILHVVWDHYEPIYYADQGLMPTLLLSPYVDACILGRYEQLMASMEWLPCSSQLSAVSSMTKLQVQESLFIERLESKCADILSWLNSNHQDWEKVTKILLFRAFGMRVNKESFTILAHLIPINLIEKYRDSALKIEALFFGQAGLLNQVISDVYHRSLRVEYVYLRKIHHLHTVEPIGWKFMRMRPANFPTIRIAQLAAMYQRHTRLFSRIIAAEDLTQLRQLIMEPEVNAYWQDHYTFGKASTRKNRFMTDMFFNHVLGELLFNTIV